MNSLYNEFSSSFSFFLWIKNIWIEYSNETLFMMNTLFEAINRFDTNDRIKQLILILASESWARRKLTDSRVIPRYNYTESS